LEIDEMATAGKKTPIKRAAAAPKRAAARKKAAMSKLPAKKLSAKGPAKGNFFRNILNDARGQVDEFVDSAKLKAKEIAAKERLMQKKAELAANAEIDKARHLAQQAEKWMKARIKSDTRKINRLERKLTRQLRDVERKLVAQARVAEKKASKQGRTLKKKFESGTKQIFGKAPVKAKAAVAKKKVTAPKKKAASAKAKSRAKT
jgi:colicin import membrane protein